MFTSFIRFCLISSEICSRLLAGSKELAELLKRTVDSQNISFSDAAKFAGYSKSEELSSVFLEKGSYSAFIELHIEQGPILEEEGRILYAHSNSCLND